MGILKVLWAIHKLDGKQVERIVQLLSDVEPEKIKRFVKVMSDERTIKGIEDIDFVSLSKASKLITVATNNITPEDLETLMGMMKMLGGGKK